MAFWNRIVRVTIGTLTISGPRIELDIKKTVSGDPEGGLRIFNLSRDREQRILERGAPITVVAGYEGTEAVIFEGAVGTVDREWKKQNRLVTLGITSRRTAFETEEQEPATVAPGEALARFGRTKTDWAYSGVQIVRRVAQDIATSAGLRIRSIRAIPEFATVSNWRSEGVSPREALRRLLNPLGVTFALDGDALIISSPLVFEPRRHTISKDAGLIRQPTRTDDGAKVQTLMLPQVQLGETVYLVSGAANSDPVTGLWKVVGVHYTGSNWTPGKFGCEFDLREATGVEANAELQEEHFDNLRRDIVEPLAR